MAMTKCPECRRDVSSDAAACPHCGKPLAKAVNPEQKTVVVAAGLSVAIAGIGLLLLMGWCG